MVKFNVVEEFLGELLTDLPHLERTIVRITNLYRQSTSTPVIQSLSVVATCKTSGEIVRLDAHVGTVVGLDSDKRACEQAEKITNQLKEFCTQHGLEIRAGIYEER